MSSSDSSIEGGSLISAIHAISQKIMRLYLRAVVNETGLNWQDWRILQAVVEMQACRAQDISTESGLQRAHVSNGLNRLEKSGHLKRVENPEHARNKLIVSTDKGRDLVASAAPKLFELESSLADSQGELESRYLLEGLKEYETKLGEIMNESSNTD